MIPCRIVDQRITGMDKHRLLEPLGISLESIIYFHHLELVLWGRSLDFTCQTETESGNKRTFSLVFVDCREVRWQHYSHIALDDTLKFPKTELINFHMGRDQHRSPCKLLTEHFGLSLFYGEVKILPANR